MSKIYEALLRAEMDRIAELNRTKTPEAGESSSQAALPGDAATALRSGTGGRSREELSAALLRSAQLVEAKAEDTPSGPRVRKLVWEPDVKLLPALEPRGALVEQIRVLRSRLYELRLDHPLKTVLITSGVPGEGKSFIASNLALGFARFRNQRVLLIDGDMRRGRLHSILGADQGPGLTDYLTGQTSLDDVLQQMQLPDSGPLNRSFASLSFLPSGSDADNAADLSGNGRFEGLLRSLYDHFDWIIIDSSPVTLVADGVNLARACDGVVLVTRAGQTKYEVAQRAQQELRASKIVGVVLNAVEDAPQVGGYYGYDG
ncbi:tyrosine-protein kinase family protein [Terriglobus aquaticus]|uniref:Tyrosine-protein kinase family protein n=1 Tax=Terriglobus aquaticus TaxID=940139 RepID=A0ABW9KGR9_9BACT|nr:CpsD/CapB family tyrosine-protein kinase [Terriglobus aquaticus]